MGGVFRLPNLHHTASASPSQVSQVQSSLQVAFQHAEHHKGVFRRYQDMVLEDAELDIPGLAEAFKIKEEVAAAAEAAAAEAAKGERDLGDRCLTEDLRRK